MPHEKKTSAEVACIKAKVEQLQKRIEELAKKKLQMLAKMEEDQDLLDQEKEDSAVMSLKDIGMDTLQVSDQSGKTSTRLTRDWMVYAARKEINFS